MTTALKNGGITKCTFLLNQQLQLIFNGLVPLRDVHVEGVIAARFVVCGLLPALKRLQKTVPRLGAHMVN